MTFTTTFIRQAGIFGDRKVTYGSWATDTDNGIIDTRMVLVQHFTLQCTGNAAATEPPSVNATFPHDGKIPIVCKTGQSGIWFALGA